MGSAQGGFRFAPPTLHFPAFAFRVFFLGKSLMTDEVKSTDQKKCPPIDKSAENQGARSQYKASLIP